MLIKDRFTQRQVIEQRLADYGITDWEYVDELPIDSINVTVSRNNNVRDEPIIRENVESMVEALRQGAVLPPIIVTKQARRYAIWSGNNRDQAHRETKRKNISAYVVSNVEPSVLRMLAVQDNLGGTFANSRDELTRHALDLLDSNQGFTVKSVAQRLNLTAGDVNAAIALREGQQRADRLGILPQWEEITRTSRAKFNQITMDEPYKSAVILAAEAGLSGELITTLVTDVRGRRSEDQQMALLAEKREQWQQRIQQVKAGVNPKGRGRRGYDPINTLAITYGQIHKFDTREIIRQVRAMPADERSVVVERLHQTTNTMAELCIALPLPKGRGKGKTVARKRTSLAR